MIYAFVLDDSLTSKRFTTRTEHNATFHVLVYNRGLFLLIVRSLFSRIRNVKLDSVPLEFLPLNWLAYPYHQH